ncbi:MAG: hypothetical protein QXK18_02935 [Candidatus Bathyarchaeia archaeon]
MVTQRMEAFKKALVEAVDEGLLMLGENGREVIYFRLKQSYALKKEDIPGHPEIFVECLRSIFGSGAEVIEKAVIKSLYSKLGMEFHAAKNFGFLEYLKEARKAFEEKAELSL